MNPRKETSNTLPGRKRRRYKPINSAIGMVMAMVNTAQGLAFKAFTTISDATASRITMMLITAA